MPTVISRVVVAVPVVSTPIGTRPDIRRSTHRDRSSHQRIRWSLGLTPPEPPKIQFSYLEICSDFDRAPAGVTLYGGIRRPAGRHPNRPRGASKSLRRPAVPACFSPGADGPKSKAGRLTYVGQPSRLAFPRGPTAPTVRRDALPSKAGRLTYDRGSRGSGPEVESKSRRPMAFKGTRTKDDDDLGY
jgi:hypothetical protein